MGCEVSFHVRRSGDEASISRKPQEVRAQLLKAVLIERATGVGEDEPPEARFEARGPIVKRDPLCITAAVPVEPGLDFQLAPVVDGRIGINLRRRSDDPVPNVSTEIALKLFDALGKSPIRRDDNIDRIEFSKKRFQPRQMAEKPAAERVVHADKMKNTIDIQEQQVAGITGEAGGIVGQRHFCHG